MGTLFGLGQGPREYRAAIRRNTLADGHPIRTQGQYLGLDGTWSRNTLADGHPIRTVITSSFSGGVYSRNTLADGHPIRTWTARAAL